MTKKGAKSVTKKDPRWLWYWWPAFLIATPAVLFGVPEALAIMHPGTGGTLSEMTREWIGVDDGYVGWSILGASGLLFWVWFMGHLRRWWPWERNKTPEAHLVEFRTDGWVIQHPLSCRPNLFACPMNRVTENVIYPPGIYECWLTDDNEFIIGDKRRGNL